MKKHDMKKYKLEFILSDGKLTVNSESEGFNGLEILGLLVWKQKDIENQLFGDIKPDFVSRKIIED